MRDTTLGDPATIAAIVSKMQLAGAPTRDFGELNAIARVFHLSASLIDEFCHEGEEVQLLEELKHAVLPFDCFTIDIDDPTAIPFVDAKLNVKNLASYVPRRYLFATSERNGTPFFLIGDITDNIARDGTVQKAASFGLYDEELEGDEQRRLVFKPLRPRELPPDHFSVETLSKEEQVNQYYGKIFVGFIRFAILLNHRGTQLERFDDPLRPINRQQRRSSGYVDIEHYRIVLRGRLTFTQALSNVITGKSLRYSPRRRHAVETFQRTYRSGKTGSVLAHMRGGKLAPGPDYDARAAILNAVNDRRAITASPHPVV